MAVHVRQCWSDSKGELGTVWMQMPQDNAPVKHSLKDSIQDLFFSPLNIFFKSLLLICTAFPESSFPSLFIVGRPLLIAHPNLLHLYLATLNLLPSPISTSYYWFHFLYGSLKVFSFSFCSQLPDHRHASRINSYLAEGSLFLRQPKLSLAYHQSLPLKQR